MLRKLFPFGVLAHPGLLAAISLLLGIGLFLLLWNPWQEQGISGGRTLVFACAAGVSKPVTEIADLYQKTYGVTIQLDFGGSGKLLAALKAQKTHGDLYLSADADLMQKAVEEGLVAEVIPVTEYKPVLVIRKTSQEQLRQQGKPVTGLRDLLRPDLKVVLANPKITSIGTLMQQVLEKHGLWAELARQLKSAQPRVSTVGTVNEVAEIVASRNGFVGILWDANARQVPRLEIIVPEELAGVGERVLIGVLSRSTQPTAALQFARFLTARDRGLPIFAKHYYTPHKEADVWEERPRIHLAVGAMLKPGVEDTIKSFSQREGAIIDTSFAGCGLLVSQMEAIKTGQKPGHFPDAYFACDVEFLDKVQKYFDAAVIVSRNNAVLAVPRGNPKKVTGLRDLTRQDLRIGLAHPKNSALGKLMDDLLRHLDLHQEVYAPGWEKRIVHADAGHDLVNKLRAGALDVAVVYRSNARSSPGASLELEVIDLDDPRALATQPFAIARDSNHPQLLRRLLRAIVSQPSAERFRRLGFEWVYSGK